MAATSHRRHRHHTPPLGEALVPLEPPHFPLRFQTGPSLDPPSWSPKTAMKQKAVWTVFQQTFGLSLSLISPPNLTSKVLRPRVRSRRDPLRVKQRGTTSSS
ncbi:hypothetical protein L3X38_036573 [Prunus dulcis]|uniref:Uncharacterized protein n=1 Tax=Prunus dulcis TaxID=3755 RepID=A0AAD4YPJ8_PRUDU|nr:hypothetical protein L3X38_036573 [Prunus dulcis]